ncbi:collagenase [Kitasatospora sp. NPDC006697]|uniref:collagenase n=1 Tax=Kitasatospora sp. NPDC006697 TaxID=3364020 RepID=UPI0036C4E767
MRLRIPLPTLMAGVVAGAATAATLLPAPAFAAPSHPLTGAAQPAAASAPLAPKPLGPLVAASEELGDTDAPLPAAILGQASMAQPAGTALQIAPRTLKKQAPAATPTGAPGQAGTTATAGAAAATAQTCNPSDFGSRTGADLVSFVKGSTTDCMNTLYNVTGTDAGSIFKQSQMLTVANEFKRLAAGYTGDNSSGIWQLVLFLRAGYYVQSYNAGAVGAYDSSLTTIVKSGLDAFFAGQHWTDVTDANGLVLYDVLVLTDSANLQSQYLKVYNQVLSGYNNSYNSAPKMVNAVNAVFSSPLWRGNWNTDFTSAIAADPTLINTLGAFVPAHKDLLGTANAFLDINAGNDLARMAGDGAAVEALAKPLVKKALDGITVTGATGPLYVHLAWNANYYDNSQCSYYGTCNLPAKLTAAVLPNQLVCDNRSIVTEALSAADLANVCNSLRGEDTFFHNLVKDSGPVNPYGKTITLAVFANQADYLTYSWAIFNNSTNNGGQTVMDPTDPTKQAVSVMYQKSWNDSFPANVWNLNHEYTHYLDNIYDMKGNFTTEISVPDIWWIEGVAEYESYSYRGLTDTQAMTEAAKHTYPLSTILQNTYDNSDSTRTYPWGYLAVRYMFEKHPDVVQNMLTHFRAGDYTGGYAVYNGLGTGYDADFNAWLDACAGGACYAEGPTALFGSTVNGATVSLTDKSVVTASTSPITAWHWTFGDGTSSDERNPSHSYAAAGTYTVALTVTDGNGKSDSTPTSVTVTVGAGTGTVLPACTDQRTDAMGQNCSRSNESATAGNTDYKYIYLPAGTSTLKVTTAGGTGTGYLYYNDSTWASPSAFTASSTNPGTTQSITVTNPTAGYRYISIYAQTDISGVTISTQY